jgi:hypothetical protein
MEQPVPQEGPGRCGARVIRALQPLDRDTAAGPLHRQRGPPPASFALDPQPPPAREERQCDGDPPAAQGRAEVAIPDRHGHRPLRPEELPLPRMIRDLEGDLRGRALKAPGHRQHPLDGEEEWLGGGGDRLLATGCGARPPGRCRSGLHGGGVSRERGRDQDAEGQDCAAHGRACFPQTFSLIDLACVKRSR